MNNKTYSNHIIDTVNKNENKIPSMLNLHQHARKLMEASPSLPDVEEAPKMSQLT